MTQPANPQTQIVTTPAEPLPPQGSALIQAPVEMASYTRGLEPTNMSELWKLATSMHRAQICNVQSPDEAIARILAGRALGLNAMQSLMGINIIENRPCMDAALMHALCLQTSSCEMFEHMETTAERSVFKIKRREWSDAKLHTFTMDEAKQALLLDRGKDPKQNNWNKWPKRMLEARAKSSAARLYFPERCFGMFTADEISEEDDRIQVRQVSPAEISVAVARAERDVGAEVAALKTEITKATTKDQRTAVRDKLQAFGRDVGGPAFEELTAFYNAALEAAKKATTAKAPTPPPEQPAQTELPVATTKPIRQPGED